MNPHERAFVETFIAPDRRDRFRAALANPKKRAIFNRELHHPKSNFLLTRYIKRIVPSQQYTQFIATKLRNMGATDHCWVFGNHIDGKHMNLVEALDALIGTRSGTIISCLPGKLAFLENEDERVILRKL